VVRLALHKQSFVKFQFMEDVYMKDTNKLVLKGIITCAVTIGGRPVKLDMLPEGIKRLMP
jgi:hypothetical protein